MLDESIDEQRRVLPAPREGWLSVVLLGVMLLSLCWAVQAAGWLDLLDFLPPVAIWALITGLILGTSRLSVALTIPIAAVAGAAIVLWTVGGEYHPELDQLGRLDAMRAVGLGAAVTAARFGSIQQAIVLALTMGALIWTTAYTAAFAVYRRHQVLDAILLIGAFLIVNLVATVRDLFGLLVLFALAALLLWLRAALVERRSGWQIRRVSENVDVPTSIMRSGVMFTVAAIVLAWVLTSVAVAAPLTAAVQNLDQIWLGLADEASGFLQGLNSGNARPVGAGFGPRMTVGSVWSTSEDPILTLLAERPYYLTAVTYDHYTGRGWARTDGRPRSVGAEQDVFPAWTPDRPLVEEGFELKTVTVQILRPQGRDLFTPGFPVRFFAPVVVTEPGGLPFMGGLEAAGALSPEQMYDVTAVISEATEAQLAAASTDYEEEVVALYLGTEGITDQTRQLAENIAAGATNPYDRAKAIATFLRTNPAFAYDTSVTPPTDPNQDLVDYFVFEGQRGFCTYYASAMVMMARSLGIPARLAVGYAPGERVEAGVYEITARNAHAWAELYFPGYGWQIFEATKSIDPKFARLSGDPAGARPIPSGRGVDFQGPFQPGIDSPTKLQPTATFVPIPGGFQAGQTSQTDEARANNGWIFLALAGGAVLVGAWRWFSARRGFRFMSPGDRGWARLNLAAQRAGVGRRPAETFYEYAGWLEAEVPGRAAEIRTIADGKVWSAYSGRAMSQIAIEAIERAWDRLRLPLAGLALRRRIGALFGRRR
ncbi:MAG: transglutaminaseTgpA domain-containing protein [Candidatus Limnocylindria bacterium]